MSADVRSISPVFLDLREERIRVMDAPTAPCAVSLGNFDGVHKAHAELLKTALAMRNECMPDGLCGVFSFFHPSSDYRPCSGSASAPHTSSMVLRKAAKLQHLTPLKEKLRLFKACGMDFVCLCDFNDIRTLTPDEFLIFLSDTLGIRGVVCGFNFRFGINGTGNAELLSAAFNHPDRGLFCKIVPPYCSGGEAVSATRIRKLLSEGNIEAATLQLGHPYALETRVVTGKRLGRQLGFPTANQNFLPESLIPARGVYAVVCHTPQGIFPGVANVGSHPTVDEHAAVNCETHVLGSKQNLYGYCMRVEFLHRLRDEEHFSSLDELTRAIAHDAAQATAYVTAYLNQV